MSDNSKPTASVPRTPQYCLRCQNHGLNIAVRRHKRYCAYRYCNCEMCRVIHEMHREMALQTGLRRAQAQDAARSLNENQVSPPASNNANLSNEQQPNNSNRNEITPAMMDEIFQKADALRRRTEFVYEMMPFFYGLMKLANNDESLVMEVLNEGRHATNENTRNLNANNVETVKPFDFNSLLL